MSKLLVVARREIAERSFVFVAALVLSIAPLGALLTPGASRPKFEGISILSVIIGNAFVAGLAAVLGASLVGREAREKRLSFYFSRPLSAAQLWFGKLLAAVVLLVVSGAILFIPPFALYPRTLQVGWNLSLWLGVLLLFGICVVLLLAIHAAATMVRSRTAWLAVDFAAVLLAIAGSIAAMLPLLLHRAVDLARGMAVTLGAIAILALVCGGAVQLARGRVDARAQHRALSQFLWSVAGVAVLLALAFTGWVRSVTVHDLEPPLWARGTPSAIRVSGMAAHRGDYGAAFFLDPKSGRSLEIGWIDLPTAVSEFGNAVAWIEPRTIDILRWTFGARKRATGELRLARRRAGRLEAVGTGIEVSTFTRLAVSDDGSRVAVLGETLAVHDVDLGKVVAAAPFAPFPRSWADIHFLRSGVVRVEETRPSNPRDGGEEACRIRDFDPRTKRLTEVFARNAGVRLRAISLGDGGKIAIYQEKAGPGGSEPASSSLLDLATGREIVLAGSDARRLRGMNVLRDGRIAIFAADGKLGRRDRNALLVFSPGGELIREVPLSEALWPRMGGEVAPGKIVVSFTAEGSRGTTMLVDADLGTVVRKIDGTLPWRDWSPFGVAESTDPECVVITREGIVIWNALTGATRKVL